jgi:hypothetical protein
MIVLITRGPFRCAISLTCSPLFLTFLLMCPRSLVVPSGVSSATMDGSLTTPPAPSYYHGVQLRMSCPYMSPQNGKAERMIHTTKDVMCSLLFYASLPACYWAESLHAATYLLILLRTKAISVPSPDFALFGTTPSYAQLQVFGCAYYPTPLPPLPISSPLVPICVSFLGTPMSTRGTGV